MSATLLSLFIFATAAPQQESVSWPTYNTKKTLYAKNDLRGKKAPKIEVEKWLTGKAPELKGKTIVLDMWATWCPPCRATIPDLNKIATKFKDSVVVIGVSGEESAVVTKFMQSTPMNYFVATDSLRRLDKAIGVDGIPHVLVISPDGIVRWQGFPLDDADPLTEAVVEKIVAAGKAQAVK